MHGQCPRGLLHPQAPFDSESKVPSTGLPETLSGSGNHFHKAVCGHALACPPCSSAGPWAQGTALVENLPLLPAPQSAQGHLPLRGFVTLSSILSVHCGSGLLGCCDLPPALASPRASSAHSFSPVLLTWHLPGPPHSTAVNRPRLLKAEILDKGLWKHRSWKLE